MAGQILPDNPTSTKLLGSLSCRNAATWDIRLYFPYEERHAEDFYARKIRRVRPGLNPRTFIGVYMLGYLRLSHTVGGIRLSQGKIKGRVLGIRVLYDTLVIVLHFVPLLRCFSLNLHSLDVLGSVWSPLLPLSWLKQACQTCGPRAACGPLQAHLRPARRIL
jgi:hypothetical protein